MSILVDYLIERRAVFVQVMGMRVPFRSNARPVIFVQVEHLSLSIDWRGPGLERMFSLVFVRNPE